MDVDAIRRDGRFSDENLMEAAAERDRGFDVFMFAHQLEQAQRLQAAQVARYGISPAELQTIKDRCIEWAAQLREGAAR